MERNRFIDVLKGILIIFVIILHFPYSVLETQKYLFPFHISLAVPCFMLISGYVSALSLQKRGVEKVEESYKLIAILERMLRFTVPYAIAFIAEWCVFRIMGLYKVGIRTYGILALVMDFLRGGKGPGSYYYPIMIQFIIVFPIVFFVIKKHYLKGLLFCFLTNGIYEVLKTAYGMNDVEYRFLIFRYLFVIAAGCYIAMGKLPEMRKTMIISVICIMIGGGFIFLFSYTSYTSKIITFWRESSFVVCLFIVPILGWLIKNVHWKFKPLEVIGKASFNIFLVQMIYYNFVDSIYDMIQVRGMQLLINVVICVGVGVFFYYLEQPLTKFLISKVRKVLVTLH